VLPVVERSVQVEVETCLGFPDVDHVEVEPLGDLDGRACAPGHDVSQPVGGVLWRSPP